MPVKYSSKGTALQVEVASVFTAVAQIDSIDLPSGDVQFFDGTALDSGVSTEPNELTGQSAPTPCTGSMFYDPADAVHLMLAGDPLLPVHRDWKVIMPDTGASVATFTGAMKTYAPKAKVGDGFKADFEIRPRTLPTYPTDD